MANFASFMTVAPSGSDQHWRVAQRSSKQLILSASQDERVHGSIFNNAAAALYLRFGDNSGMAVSGALGAYDVRLTSASYYELSKPVWQGEVWGVWENDLSPQNGGGFAMVLQFKRTDG